LAASGGRACLSLFLGMRQVQRGVRHAVPTPSIAVKGIILPVGNMPDLLDFSPLSRK
jgi:hypothetical protein